MEKEKVVKILIDGYPRYCKESKVPKVLQNIEDLKEYYRKKGVPEEKLTKMYTVEIVRDED